MITLENLCVQFGGKLVLDHFSLTLPAKGILCLSGPSGCGKTTLLRVICGLEKPQSGTLVEIGRCAVVFQEDRLLPWLTVEKNLTAVAGISAAEAGEWLDAVGLFSERKSLPESLSGGMRRRVAIARALAAKSELLLLDEPFQGLDAQTKEKIYPLVTRYAAEKPVILVTHHREEAEALGAEILELSGPPLAYGGKGRERAAETMESE